MSSFQNRKSGQEMAKQKRVTRQFSKTDQRYWRARVFKNTFTRNGKKRELKDYSVRIAHLGKRETFSLRSPNKDVAASLAAEIYICVIGRGWDEAVATYKAKPEKRSASTVGEYLRLAESVSTVSPRTFSDYSRALRMVVGGNRKVGKISKAIRLCKWGE